MERLYRSHKNRVIAGVAGGLGEYFGVDVVLVRLLWVLSVFLGGSGGIIYIIAWIIIPEERNVFTGSEGSAARQRDHAAAKTTMGEEQTGDEGAGSRAFVETNEEADKTAWQTDRDEAGTRRRRNAGLVLVGLGIVFLAHQLFGPLFRFTWPLLLVALGFYLLFRERKEEGK